MPCYAICHAEGRASTPADPDLDWQQGMVIYIKDTLAECGTKCLLHQDVVELPGTRDDWLHLLEGVPQEDDENGVGPVSPKRARRRIRTETLYSGAQNAELAQRRKEWRDFVRERHRLSNASRRVNQAPTPEERATWIAEQVAASNAMDVARTALETRGPLQVQATASDVEELVP